MGHAWRLGQSCGSCLEVRTLVGHAWKLEHSHGSCMEVGHSRGSCFDLWHRDHCSVLFGIASVWLLKKNRSSPNDSTLTAFPRSLGGWFTSENQSFGDGVHVRGIFPAIWIILSNVIFHHDAKSIH